MLATERDVFGLAMALEESGREFYEALGLGCGDLEVRRFFRRLAKEEERHFATFRTLRDACGDGPARRDAPLDESSECARLAREGIQSDSAVIRSIALGGDLQAALEMAIQIEFDAIRFYRAALVSIPEAQRAFGAVISEEIAHLRELELQRTRVRAA